MAVYLSGSHLHNLENKDSDFDYIVITKPTVEDMVDGWHNGKQSNGELDFKVFNLLHFINLIKKSNPNIVELLYKFPLYVDEDFEPFAHYLHYNSDKIAKMNVLKFSKACQGNMISHFKKLKIEDPRNGKKISNIYKMSMYISSMINNENLSDIILFKDTEKRDYVKRLKESHFKEDFVQQYEIVKSIVNETSIKLIAVSKKYQTDTSFNQDTWDKILFELSNVLREII